MSTSSSSAAERDPKREFLKKFFAIFVVSLIGILIFFFNHHEKNKNNSRICLKNLLSLEDIQNRKNDIDVICKDVLNWTKPNYQRSISSKTVDLKNLKFDFVYLDPPYDADFHELVLNQLFNCNFLKKESIVICEHSPNLFIKKSTLWETIDVRNYGQTRLTFLINVKHS